jgi:anti-sigma28 factor (negative regulator of flagellin synthesis)
MKVNSFQAQDIYSSYSKASQAANSDKTAAINASKHGDKLEISQKGKTASLIEADGLAKKSMTTENQNQRANRVSEIKNQVQSSNYNVSSTLVARSILKGNLFDQRV